VEAFKLEVTKRDKIGSSHARRVRASGSIPGVMYHRNEEPVLFSVNTNGFKKLATRAKKSQVFLLDSESAELNNRSIIVKDVQFHPVKDTVLHLDFLALKDDELVTVSIPLVFTGEAYGVKTDGGMLAIANREIEVKCFPKEIPSEIAVDVTSLKLGQSIHAGELLLSEKITLVTDEKEVIVSVLATRAGVSEAGSTPS
jgi:large subunit ribosomal protein L25